MNTVQNDIWTLVGLLGMGILPLALAFLFFKPKPFEPRPGPPADAYKEALTENEAYTFEAQHGQEQEAEEAIPGDGPLTFWQRVLYEIGVVAAASLLSLGVILLVRLFLFFRYHP